MRPRRSDITRALRDLNQLWKPPKETAPTRAGGGADGDTEKDSAGKDTTGAGCAPTYDGRAPC